MIKNRFNAAICLVGCCLLFLCGCVPQQRGEPPAEPIATGVIFAFDTVIEQKWYGDNAQAAYDAVCALISEIEGEISIYLPGSELARLCEAAGGEPVELSERTFALLKRAKELSEQHSDYFDITIQPLVELWDISGGSERVPDGDEVAAALALMGTEWLVLDEQAHTAALTREGMGVDLGALAKGWMCDRVLEVIEQHGVERGYISLGGNMLVVGTRPDGSDFVFGIRDPRGGAGDYIGTVRLKGLTMSTTGDYERFFMADGRRYHHVFDPATGYPAQGGLISVSVISPDGMLAEHLSTTMFVAGLDYAVQHLDGQPYMMVLVDEAHNVYISPGLAGNYNHREGTGYTLITNPTPPADRGAADAKAQ